MPDLQDPELAERLDRLAEEGTIYQVIGHETVRYVVERGRHYFGVKVEIESQEWENIEGCGPGDMARWVQEAVAIHPIDEWGDSGEVPN